MQQTVTISDRRPIFRQGLMEIVSKMHVKTISECATGDLTWRDILRYSPDVAIVSSDIQRIKIRDLAERIKERKLSTRLLAIVKHQDGRYCKSLLECGAHGLVGFDAPAPEVAKAIKILLNNEIFVSEALQTQPVNSKQLGESTDTACDVVLSERETDVLMLVARGFSNKEMAFALGISIRTIESHRYHLRLKTGARKSSDLALFAAKTGLVNLSDFAVDLPPETSLRFL